MCTKFGFFVAEIFFSQKYGILNYFSILLSFYTESDIFKYSKTRF